jgi:hypothetical protein
VSRETAVVTDEDRVSRSENEDSGTGDGTGDGEGDLVMVLDRFLAAGISREAFDAHLAAGRIAVAGERITDPATAASRSADVQIMLDPF